MDLEQLVSGGPNPCGDSVKKTSTHFLIRIGVDVGPITTVEPIAQLAEHVFVTERSVAQVPGVSFLQLIVLDLGPASASLFSCSVRF